MQAVLETLVPAVTAVLAVLSGVEGFSAKRLLGICCAMAGALSIVTRGASGRGMDGSNALEPTGGAVLSTAGGAEREREEEYAGQLAKGNALVLLSSSAYALFTVQQKTVLASTSRSTLAVTAMTTVLGGLLIICTCLLAGERVWPATIRPSQLAGLVYTSGVTTIVGYMLQTWANTHASPTTVNIYFNIQPARNSVLNSILHSRIPVGIRTFALLAALPCMHVPNSMPLRRSLSYRRCHKIMSQHCR
jgi:drug/metabolite transporter (DMT)-like permease